MRLIVALLVFLLMLSPVLAETIETSSIVTAEAEKLSFLQEVDITFWQTLPFAVLWGHFIDRQLSVYLFPGSAPHWQAILPFAVIVSTGNALIHARRGLENERTRNNN